MDLLAEVNCLTSDLRYPPERRWLMASPRLVFRMRRVWCEFLTRSSSHRLTCRSASSITNSSRSSRGRRIVRRSVRLHEDRLPEGGDVLPGFSLSIREWSEAAAMRHGDARTGVSSTRTPATLERCNFPPLCSCFSPCVWADRRQPRDLGNPVPVPRARDRSGVAGVGVAQTPLRGRSRSTRSNRRAASWLPSATMTRPAKRSSFKVCPPASAGSAWATAIGWDWRSTRWSPVAS